MEKSAWILLEKLIALGKKSPEKWSKTPVRSSFIFFDNPAISISKFLGEDGVHKIVITLFDEHGHTLENAAVKEGDNPDLFKAYLEFYEQVKELAGSNDFTRIANALA